MSNLYDLNEVERRRRAMQDSIDTDKSLLASLARKRIQDSIDVAEYHRLKEAVKWLNRYRRVVERIDALLAQSTCSDRPEYWRYKLHEIMKKEGLGPPIPENVVFTEEK